MLSSTRLILTFLMLLPAASLAAVGDQPYELCPTIEDDTARLVCYDSFVVSETVVEGIADAERANLQREILSELRDEPLFGFGVDGLTNHEPNKLLARMDSNDINRLYMDATLSVKHPVLSPVVDLISDLFEIDRARNLPRLYLAFTTRFSQYLGSRESSPVVARRYSPELFLRVWREGGTERGDPAYWDFGYGHESNGQQIETEEAFALAQANAVDRGDPPWFARDQLSRGWDYLSIDWHKQWNTGLLPDLPGRTETHIEHRYYLQHGLFQGSPEEYNVWEEDGAVAKTRDYYDGLRLSVQYTLSGTNCIALVCFERVEISHHTGHAKPFQHNTTSLEITTDIAGLPLHLWTRSGYNSDLVDYFDYTNSWGLGIEFLR